jgi:hypothetical protein
MSGSVDNQDSTESRPTGRGGAGLESFATGFHSMLCPACGLGLGASTRMDLHYQMMAHLDICPLMLARVRREQAQQGRRA